MKRGKSFSITAPRMDKESYLDEKAALSPEERELADCDLYGKARSMPEETDEFRTVKLAELANELDKIRDKPAYDLAVERCHDYVKGQDFELLFLRADYFDAAVRVVVIPIELRIVCVTIGSIDIISNTKQFGTATHRKRRLEWYCIGSPS